MHAIALSESLVAPGLVLIHANCQVVRHPDVENAGLGAHDVDEKMIVAHVVPHRCIHDTRRKQQTLTPLTRFDLQSLSGGVRDDSVRVECRGIAWTTTFCSHENVSAQ